MIVWKLLIAENNFPEQAPPFMHRQIMHRCIDYCLLEKGQDKSLSSGSRKIIRADNFCGMPISFSNTRNI